MPGIIFFTLSLYDPFDLCPFKIHKLGDLKPKNVDYFFLCMIYYFQNIGAWKNDNSTDM